MVLEGKLMLTAGYSAGTKIFMGIIGSIGPALFAAAFAAEEQNLSLGYWLGLAALALIWVFAMLDLVSRRLWLFSDRIVVRGPLLTKRTIYFQEVMELLRGSEHLVVNARDGRSIRVPARIEYYDRIIHEIARATGHRL